MTRTYETGTAIAGFLFIGAILLPSSASAAPSPLRDRMVEAYGGSEALLGIESIQYEWAGYYIAQHQGRYTEPPYTRYPYRLFVAFDYEEEKGVSESISTYGGGLDMSMRTVIDGDEITAINTITQFTTEHYMTSHQGMINSATRVFPWLLVRKMLVEDGVPEVADSREHLGITYNVVSYDGLEMLVHPETSLIYSYSWNGHDLTTGGSPARRVFNNYQEYKGVMVNSRYQSWRNGEAVNDMRLHTYQTDIPVDPYLEVPDGLASIPNTMGYSGQMGTSVDQIDDGVYVAGDGETRILYVEFDDYFVAMEAGGFPENARATYEAMQPYMKDKPLRYIIPTHYHDDHAIAVHFYARAGATILTTRDKEGYLRRLLARSWGEEGPVEGAKFEYIDGDKFTLSDASNRLDVLVYADAPHTENMLVGYLPEQSALFSADVFIGWAGPVTQGSSYGMRHMQNWLDELRAKGSVKRIESHIPVHGRIYSRQEWDAMLARERVVLMLPDNRLRPADNWFEEYGLYDDTRANARRGISNPLDR